MANENTKINIKLPEPSLRRLPWYLAYVKLLKDKGEEYVSSTQIAKEINVDASQIAKDLSFINISGKTRVGYEVNSLVEVLENFLGFTNVHKAFIFGVGSLGAALLQDSGLAQYGMNVVAGFDVKKELAGTMINGIPVYHISEFEQKQKELGSKHRYIDCTGRTGPGSHRKHDCRRNKSNLEFYPVQNSGSQTYLLSRIHPFMHIWRYVQSVK